MEIRVLIVCLRSKLRLVLIDIFSVRICCAGPVRNLDFYERLRIKHFFGGFTFPKRSDFEKGWYGMSLNFSGSWHGPQPVGLSWITGEMNSAITGTNYDLNRKKCRFLIRFRYGSSRSTVSYQTVRHSCQRNLKLNLDSWAGNEDITGPYPFLLMFFNFKSLTQMFEPGLHGRSSSIRPLVHLRPWQGLVWALIKFWKFPVVEYFK